MGGTLFLGRHVVETALARGHFVTTFTRGRTNPELFPQVEALHGDRDTDLTALRGRRFDAVVDTSAYFPRQVDAAAAALSRGLDRYCLVSTASVYTGFPAEHVSESSSTLPPADDPATPLRGDTYGSLKVACEQAALRTFRDAAFIVRPGLLAGPFDPTDRLSYWTQRICDGGEVLAPGDPAHPIQLLDARDLADWIVERLEQGQSGISNVAGAPLSMESMLHTCRDLTGSEATFRWASDAFLLGHGLYPSSDIPLWLPADMPGSIDDSAARALGLRSRSFAETVRDSLHDDVTVRRPALGPARPTAMSRAREQDLLRLLMQVSTGH
jgi:2'-hydroxyisoflavone reductase